MSRNDYYDSDEEVIEENNTMVTNKRMSKEDVDHIIEEIKAHLGELCLSRTGLGHIFATLELSVGFIKQL